MKKTNIRAKNFSTVTVDMKSDIINTIVNSYFQINNGGEIEYTPYLAPIGRAIAIAKYLIEGIEFDKDEYIYDTIKDDEEITTLIDNIASAYEFKDMIDTVKDIVEYKKAENIARVQNESFSVLTYKMLELINKENDKVEKEMAATENLNQWINEQRELNSLITPEMQRNFAENFNPDLLTDAIIKKYSESDLYKKNQEIIEANRKLREKNNKIAHIQNELKKKEQRDNTKNVLADK